MKFYQKYLVALLVILIVSIIYFYSRSQQEFTSKVRTVIVNLLDKQIENEKVKAFNFAFALSQNETLQDAIKNNNAIKGYKILNDYMKTLETFNDSKVRIQVVSKDYVMFARSWDNSDAGLNLKKYRPDLQEIKRTLKAHLSFVAARRLVLIASIPIIKENEFIGFIEVIQRFDSLTKYFSNYDINMLVLLDDKYKNQAILLDKSPRIKNMIVANEAANAHHIEYLQQHGIDKLMKNGTIKSDRHFYFSKPILNAQGNNIGSFVLILSKQKLKLFSAFEDEINTFFTYARKDLYYSVISNKSIDIYNNATSKELLSLQKCVHEEDKIFIQEKLTKSLNGHTKSELISLLLDVNSKKISRGQIK